MTNVSITSSGTYTLATPLTNGTNIDFLNNGGTVGGVLILTDNAQGSAFNITTQITAGTISGYGANIGGGILNFQAGSFGIAGDQITIQAVADLFASLFVGGTLNTDYKTLVGDITEAALSGGHILVLPGGTVDGLPFINPFTLDAAQQLVIGEVAGALFGTAASVDHATLDIGFNTRVNPNSNTPLVDAIFTTNATINPCFAAGTRILTSRGEVAVEALGVGDVVITHAGEEQPVVWIGRRAVEIGAQTRPEAVRPVVIEAEALGEGVPGRRLVVSPDHALFLDGVLVPAKELLNWTTIRQDNAVERVTYYHVELARHDVIFAEGAPVESYLDTGHRGIFDNAAESVVALPAVMQQRREAEGCAPLCLGGPVLAEIRRKIAGRQVGVRLAAL
ncbi:Hint domain-containing protein [Acidocella sp.]|uniref:Hint domain-containing protein n=1 Tax=Acidocella sp. TaxID=50710 RepID=UPI0017D0F163|nr:Hint domain-containing protein [Acidocella sp.]NNM57684.1 Hint domain-containing protein [Acidocella sp.]